MTTVYPCGLEIRGSRTSVSVLDEQTRRPAGRFRDAAGHLPRFLLSLGLAQSLPPVLRRAWQMRRAGTAG